MCHDYKVETVLPETESGSCTADKQPDVMQEWTETWAEYFRRDETKVEAELEVLCSKLRSLAKSLES